MNAASRIDSIVGELLNLKALVDTELQVSSSGKADAQIKQLERENKALKECINELVQQRQRDRAVITEWQKVLQQTHQSSSSSEPPAETYPVSSPPRNSDSLNQRPESLVQDTGAHLPSTQTPVPSTDAASSEDRGEQEPQTPQEYRSSQLAQRLENDEDQLSKENMEKDGDTTIIPGLSFAASSDPADNTSLNIEGSIPPRDILQQMSSPMKQEIEEKLCLPRSLASLVEKDWHPSDFIVNQDYRKRFSDGRLASPGLPTILEALLTGTDITSTSNTGADQGWTVSERGDGQGQSSKRAKHYHHEQIQRIKGVLRQESPPGFWRSEFANTQEWDVEKKQLGESIKRQALHRLAEAIQNGEYLFRDPQLRQAAAKGVFN